MIAGGSDEGIMLVSEKLLHGHSQGNELQCAIDFEESNSSQNCIKKGSFGA